MKRERNERLSHALLKLTWLFFVGIVVLRLISFVKTPPNVSIPNESGVTSRRRRSVTSPPRTPPYIIKKLNRIKQKLIKKFTWIAAPIATASSGLTDLFGALPKSSWTVCWTLRRRKNRY